MQSLAEVREVIRIGWLTLAVIPDPDKRFQGWKNGWIWQVVHDAKEAYGYSSPSVRRFMPSTADITRLDDVMTWMAWLRRTEGELAMRRIMVWAYGVPIWRLGQRELRSERTIRNRIDLSIAAIMAEFKINEIAIGPIDEPPEKQALHFGDKASIGDGIEAEAAKVYISGLGYFFKGKAYDPEKALKNRKRHAR